MVFYIGNSTFLVPPWVAHVYTTHGYTAEEKKAAKATNSKWSQVYGRYIFIINVRLKLRSLFKWLLGQSWNLVRVAFCLCRVLKEHPGISPAWAGYVGQMKIPTSMAFVKEIIKKILSLLHPILQFLLFMVILTCQLDSDQETSQWQCGCQLTLLCSTVRLGRSKQLQTLAQSKCWDETPC